MSTFSSHIFLKLEKERKIVSFIALKIIMSDLYFVTLFYSQIGSKPSLLSEICSEYFVWRKYNFEKCIQQTKGLQILFLCLHELNDPSRIITVKDSLFFWCTKMQNENLYL